MELITELESEVRAYSRRWPTIFFKAVGASLWDTRGRGYTDFFSGAGALNYGHNNKFLKAALLDYVAGDGITHSLDMATSAKVEFLATFRDLILRPRNLNYKVQFTGPTGTNAVEAALKIARKVSGRSNVVAFNGAFHGMTLGALGVSDANGKKRDAGIPLAYTTRLPFETDQHDDGLEMLDAMLSDKVSRAAKPGAVIVETVQGEGGVNVASLAWLRSLGELCRRHNLLLIVDDIQVGCGRTGSFFSFERAGLEPDLICLSKSIGGYGLPMALLLIKPELDRWQPGEHSGTFRGNNLAFVTAAAAIRHYWSDSALEQNTHTLGSHVHKCLELICRSAPEKTVSTGGVGLIHGLKFNRPTDAVEVSRRAFELGLLVETAGPHDEVVKLTPPLTIEMDVLDKGLSILQNAVRECVGQPSPVSNSS